MKYILPLVLVLGFSTTVQAKDPCGSYLCMAGMVIGAGKSSECSSYVSDVASIRKFKHGKFKAGRTATKRESFLKSCSSADSGIISGIIGAYGTLYTF